MSVGIETVPVETVEPQVPGPAPLPASAEGLRLLFELDDEAAFKPALLFGTAVKRATVRRVQQVFWDTPDFAIARQGLALAAQTAARKRSQIVRPLLPVDAGAGAGVGAGTAELEAALTAETPDPARLAFVAGHEAGGTAKLLAGDLAPVFALDRKRSTWTGVVTGQSGGADVAVTLDRSEIEAAAGQQSVLRLEILGRSGPAAALFEGLDRLVEAVPLRPAATEAAALGYRLAGYAPKNGGGPVPDLDPDASLRAGILAIGRHLSDVLFEEVGRLDARQEEEQVHQSRVALRRLRSMLSVFGPALPAEAVKVLSGRLRDFATELGHAREWDVFVAETLNPLAAAFSDPHMPGALDGLRRRAGQLRETAAAQAHEAIDSGDFRKLTLVLIAWFACGLWPEPAPTEEQLALLARPLGEVAGEFLRKRHKALVKGERKMEERTAEALHELRIKAKKLRYTVEFLEPLYRGRGQRRYVRALKKLQEVLGALHDDAVAGGLVDKLVPVHGGKDKDLDIQGQRVAGLVAGWSAARFADARDRFDAVWEEFEDTKPFWKS